LEGIPEIESVTFSNHLPTGIYSNGGGYEWQGKLPEVDPLVSNTNVDFSYANTLGIKMYEGTFFIENQYDDTSHVVINRAFADIMGLEPTVGQIIKFGGTNAEVIGVTEDFNFKPLWTQIEPLIMFNRTGSYNFAFCRISSENLPKTISKIEQVHDNINGGFPFEFRFLDDEFNDLYVNEQRQGRIFNIFSFLAILISCLGLFGLSSFMITQRTKEIGIRKANGASVFSIMMMFSRYYTRWVLVAFLIALPVSYYLIHSWLKNYAYRTSISWWVFALAGLIAYAIALLTVSWQSRKAAKKNPVEALRYE
jgi:ABC-type antimicrobial peptide transport system permease subunit